MFTNDKELIKDVIQDLFLDLIEKESRISKIDNIKMYLFISFRNNLFAAIRKEKRFLTNEFDESLVLKESNYDSESIPGVFGKSGDVEQKEKLIRRYFAKLTKSQQRIIQLRYFHQLSYEEIASILSINYQSARTLLYRAIKKIRKEYNKNNEGQD